METIKKHRHFGRNKRLQYLLKWRGYPESDNTWESVEQLHAPQLLKEYHAHHPLESIKTLLIQCQTHCLSPTSVCLHSCHLSTARTVPSLLPITMTSSSSSSYSTQCVASTSAPCAPNGSSIAVASTSTFLPCMNSTQPSSTASDLEKIVQHPCWPSSMSPLPHSRSNLYSPTIIRTQKSSFTPSFIHRHIRPTNSTSSILIGNATIPLGLTPSNTNVSARKCTAATTCNQRTTYGPSIITISTISPTHPSILTHTRDSLRCLIYRLTHPISSCHNGSGVPF